MSLKPTFEFTTSTSLFMIIGGSNARVGDLSEFSDDDNIGLGSLLQGNTRSCKISRRNYCDREIKQNGWSLIELCRTYHMQIANGRFFGKHVTNEIKEIILTFLNLNLKVGITAENLCQDFITVIHKDDKKNDPDNYRGICIANSILKILSSLLEARSKEFCKKHNLIDKAQIGCQENARMSDHILTLKTICYGSKREKTLLLFY